MFVMCLFLRRLRACARTCEAVGGECLLSTLQLTASMSELEHFSEPRGVCFIDVPVSWVVNWVSLCPLVHAGITGSEGASGWGCGWRGRAGSSRASSP